MNLSRPLRGFDLSGKYIVRRNVGFLVYHGGHNNRATQLSVVDILTKESKIFANAKSTDPQDEHKGGSQLNTTDSENATEARTPRTPRHQQVGAPLGPFSSWPKRTSFRVCRECGGRRIIASSAGPFPCPACVPWQRRPDYQPDRKLLTEEDINLNRLDCDSKDIQMTRSAESTESAAEKQKPAEELDSRAAGKRARGKMTEEKRLAIRNSMKKRGPLRSDHKTRISNAMRKRYAADPSLRQAGRPKRCSFCGEIGHNRRACPKRTDVNANANANAIDGNESETNEMVTLLSSKTQEESLQLRKVIIIEEEEVEGSKQAGGPLSNAADQELSEMHKADDRVDGPREALELQENSPKTVLGAKPNVAANGAIVFPLPVRPEHCVLQAAGAVLRAWEDGIRRQSLEILLPQAGSANDGGWPGGIRQQFRVALPMVEGLLKRLKLAPSLQGRITAEWLDEGDCVGAWQSEKLAAVVFPTADALPAVQRIDDALSGKRLLLVLNPQWQPQGQIVSDFGFGKSRRQAERFVESLESVYSLRRVRVLGDEIRILRCYPGSWQVYFVRSASNTELLSVEDDKPTYQRLLELCRSFQGSRSSKSWLDRVLDGRSYDEIAAYEEDYQGKFSREDSQDIEEGSRILYPSNESVEIDIVTGEILR